MRGKRRKTFCEKCGIPTTDYEDMFQEGLCNACWEKLEGEN